MHVCLWHGETRETFVKTFMHAADAATFWAIERKETNRIHFGLAQTSEDGWRTKGKENENEEGTLKPETEEQKREVVSNAPENGGVRN